ncbi:MAG: hypothetical protein IPP15_23950 [Saprospiraceae bacterium]|uniref:DUF1761 domain-containing protein n=1 Tax=Candidatus Opimibacter skivensis TaxID=2982028 RepID=A0A9D7T158_9BACT|nr:hypothetical protein [Candidatus Opimibacter skivensis]
MKLGKIAIAALAATVFMFLTDGLWYGIIMKDSMTPMPGARPEPDMVWLVLGMLIYCIAFAYVFVMGQGSGSPVGEGTRFGIWATLFVWIPMGFFWYALIAAAPLQEYLIDDVFRLVQTIIIGIIVAYLTGMSGHRGGEVTPGKGATGGDD